MTQRAPGSEERSAAAFTMECADAEIDSAIVHDALRSTCELTAATFTASALSAAAALREARSRFAASLTEELPRAALGSISLRPDQLESARRVRSHLARDRGCLLADDVGTGKTYVALAVARSWRRPLLVVPAALRDTWRDAMRRADADYALVSHESLSRGLAPDAPFDGIVVDESHRFRPTSRRHATLARLAARVPLLLLSATPLQNRLRELAAQLALFLGEIAYRLDSPSLSRYVVRGAEPTTAILPRVAPPRWLSVSADDGPMLRAILALPPPPRAADAGDGGVLLQLSLVRAWASSRAALLATVRRRRQTLIAIEQCHEEGRLPTRRELRSWRAGDGVQLGFATLLAESSLDGGRSLALARAISAERRALDVLLSTMDAAEDPDTARIAALRSVRATHADATILAFSESASTVRAYFAALRGDPGVGMLTSHEARIASGRVPRGELLARFAPRAQGAHTPAAHDRVTLLLTTDLLSEGVNLQDASVVVHLDLPWNPARLAQRLGRVRRPGGAEVVVSYLMAPPAQAALLLRAEARLRTKLARAERTIGRGMDVMPALSAPASAIIASGLPLTVGGAPRSASSLSHAEQGGAIARVLSQWRRDGGHDAPAAATKCIVAAVSAAARGWLAVLEDGRLLAALGDGAWRLDGGSAPIVADDPAAIARAVWSANGDARTAAPFESEAARRELMQQLEHEWLLRSCGVSTRLALRSAVTRRIDDIIRTAPRHHRRVVHALASRLRASLSGPLSLGIERDMHAHAVGAPMTRRSPRGALPRVALLRGAPLVGDIQQECGGTDWLTRALALVSGSGAGEAIHAHPSCMARSVASMASPVVAMARPVAMILFGPSEQTS